METSLGTHSSPAVSSQGVTGLCFRSALWYKTCVSSLSAFSAAVNHARSSFLQSWPYVFLPKVRTVLSARIRAGSPRVCLFSLFVPALSRTCQTSNISCLFLISFCLRLSVARMTRPQKNATTLWQGTVPCDKSWRIVALVAFPQQRECCLRQQWEKFLQGSYAFSAAGRTLSLSMSTSSLPALKKGRRLGGTLMLSPVLGFRP